MTDCSYNDFYDISRNQCNYVTYKDVIKEKNRQNNIVFNMNQHVFHNYKELGKKRFQHITTKDYIIKGNPPKKYPKTMILNTYGSNTCERFIISENANAANAGYYVLAASKRS